MSTKYSTIKDFNFELGFTLHYTTHWDLIKCTRKICMTLFPYIHMNILCQRPSLVVYVVEEPSEWSYSWIWHIHFSKLRLLKLSLHQIRQVMIMTNKQIWVIHGVAALSHQIYSWESQKKKKKSGKASKNFNISEHVRMLTSLDSSFLVPLEPKSPSFQ